VVEGYERAPYWAERITGYAAEVAEYRQRQATQQAPHGDDFDSFDGGHDDDSLPF
jgi:hypothetical protein